MVVLGCWQDGCVSLLSRPRFTSTDLPAGSPSTSISEINARQSLVAFFYSRIHFRMDICEILKEVDDIRRICQRFLLGRGDFSDLIAIRSTIQTWASLKKRFQQEKVMEDIEALGSPDVSGWTTLGALFLRMDDLTSFLDKINSAIVINPETQNETGDLDSNGQDLDTESNTEPGEPLLDKAIGKKWTINPKYVNVNSLHLTVTAAENVSKSFSETLGNLQTSFQSLLRRKDELENKLRATYSNYSVPN